VFSVFIFSFSKEHLNKMARFKQSTFSSTGQIFWVYYIPPWHKAVFP